MFKTLCSILANKALLTRLLEEWIQWYMLCPWYRRCWEEFIPVYIIQRKWESPSLPREKDSSWLLNVWSTCCVQSLSRNGGGVRSPSLWREQEMERSWWRMGWTPAPAEREGSGSQGRVLFAPSLGCHSSWGPGQNLGQLPCVCYEHRVPVPGLVEVMSLASGVL